MIWPFNRRHRRREREQREAGVMRDTISTASVKAQAEVLVKQIRANLDQLDGVLSHLTADERAQLEQLQVPPLPSIDDPPRRHPSE